MYEAVFFYSDLSSDFMLVPHTFINLTGEKISIRKKIWKVDPNVQKRDDETLDPSTRVLTVLARISKRGCKLSSFVQSQQR